jgi:prepilin peptidase CpaA
MNPAAPYAYAALLGILVVAAWSDIKTERIPNAFTIPAIFAGIVFWVIAALILGGNGQDVVVALKASAYAGLAAFTFWAIIFVLGGVGAGDVKVMTIVGTWSASMHCVLGTIVYTLIATALLSIYIMIKRKIVKETLTRLYCALFSLAARVKPDLENEKNKIPFVVPIFIGAAIAGVEYMLGFKFPWTT